MKIIMMTIGLLAVFGLAACGNGGNGSSYKKMSAEELTQLAATGNQEAMQELEARLAKETSQPADKNTSAPDPLAAFQQAMIGSDAAKIRAAIEKLAEQDNPNARLYLAQLVVFDSAASAEDKAAARATLEDIGTNLDDSFMHQTLSNQTYPLAAEAAYSISDDYLGGAGLYEMNTEEAIKWLKIAAQKGHPEAMFKLAVRYQYGLDMDSDMAQAKDWMQKSTKAGYRQAAEELAKM
ncbi:MAG: tetratricopeptide repeat protein [bacterium]